MRVLLENVEYQLSQMIRVVMNTSKDYSIQLAFLFHKNVCSVYHLLNGYIRNEYLQLGLCSIIHLTMK